MSLPVWGVMLAKDEADIIGTNLRHHFALGLSGIVVFDNMSRDDTGEIAKAAGANVFLDEQVAFMQGDKNRRMTEIAVSHGAEWVLAIDADEMWYPTKAATIPEAIEAIRTGIDVVRAISHDYVCSEFDNLAESNPVLRMRWRYAMPGNAKVAHRCLPGAHVLGANENWSLGDGQPPRIYNGLRIKHYPVRSLQQLKRKAVNGWRAVNKQRGVHRNACGHWRKWYYRFRIGGFNSFFNRKLVLTKRRLAAKPAAWREDPFVPAHLREV